MTRPPNSQRTDTLFPYPTLFRSGVFGLGARGLQRAFDLGRAAGLVDQAQRTVEVVDDRRQRLVELVRERRRHLADRHPPRGEQQLFLLRLARVERLDALADLDRGQKRQRLAVVLSLAPVQRD